MSSQAISWKAAVGSETMGSQTVLNPTVYSKAVGNWAESSQALGQETVSM